VIAGKCERITRRLQPAPHCVEMVSDRAAQILPALCRRLERLHDECGAEGGSVRAYVVAGPVVHMQQIGDQSCAYRAAQVIISHMLHDRRRFPGACKTFIDEPSVRHELNAVPSVNRLQRSVEKAWQAGYDPVGAMQLGGSTLNKEHARAHGIPLPTRLAPLSGPNVLLYSGKPTVHSVPPLSLLGSADIWAMMRWTGMRAELHDFIDGEEPSSPKASDLLFDWVWDHFCRHTSRHLPEDVHSPVRRCAACPLFLQWAGHAVAIVGAVRRQLNRHATPERHLLLYNSEKGTEELYEALTRELEGGAPADTGGTARAKKDWWKMLAWSAKRGGERVIFSKATEQSEKWGESHLGPGGENGPYQVIHVRAGWELNELRRASVRSPEDLCVQHVGDAPPVHAAAGDGLAAAPVF
jgi:hypothetical protein